MSQYQSDPDSPTSGWPQPGTVEVAHESAGTAVVSVRGEHDISTEPRLTWALEQAAAHSNVLVDLSECTFVDSTAITALIKAARAVHERGELFAVVIPPGQKNVARVAEMIRLGEFLDVHASRETALASLEHSVQQDPAA